MRCVRDKKGRFASHQFKRSVMQWECTRCGRIIETFFKIATERGERNVRDIINVMNETNKLLTE